MFLSPYENFISYLGLTLIEMNKEERSWVLRTYRDNFNGTNIIGYLTEPSMDHPVGLNVWNMRADCHTFFQTMEPHSLKLTHVCIS